MAHPVATADIASLANFGFSQAVIDAWAGGIPRLNQLACLNLQEFLMWCRRLSWIWVLPPVRSRLLVGRFEITVAKGLLLLRLSAESGSHFGLQPIAPFY